MKCPAKIRPFRPVNDTELECGREEAVHMEHEATLRDYAYPGSMSLIIWEESDRRNFVGDFETCTRRRYGLPCILPNGHGSTCAT